MLVGTVEKGPLLLQGGNHQLTVAEADNPGFFQVDAAAGVGVDQRRLVVRAPIVGGQELVLDGDIIHHRRADRSGHRLVALRGENRLTVSVQPRFGRREVLQIHAAEEVMPQVDVMPELVQGYPVQGCVDDLLLGGALPQQWRQGSKHLLQGVHHFRHSQPALHRIGGVMEMSMKVMLVPLDGVIHRGEGCAVALNTGSAGRNHGLKGPGDHAAAAQAGIQLLFESRTGVPVVGRRGPSGMGKEATAHHAGELVPVAADRVRLFIRLIMEML